MVAVFRCWLLLSALLILTKDAEACDPRCRKYTFCTLGGKGFAKVIRFPSMVMHAPGTGSYPFICRREGRRTSHIRVNETGEALVSQGRSRRTVRISAWKPVGLPAPDPPFKSGYFGAFDIPKSLLKMQGVGRMQSRGNQESLIDDLCVRLPITSYFSVDDFGFANGPTITPRNDSSNCISFRTKAPELVADFFWNKESDHKTLDVDIFLTDINKKRLNIEKYIGRSTRCEGCRTLYVPKISPGQYRIGFSVKTTSSVVRHVNNGISHSCPGRFGGGRFLSFRQFGGTLSIVNALLHVTVRGVLVSDQTRLVRVKGDDPTGDFFRDVITVPRR